MTGYKTVVNMEIQGVNFLQPVCVAPIQLGAGYQVIIGYDLLRDHGANLCLADDCVKFNFNISTDWNDYIIRLDDSTTIKCDSLQIDAELSECEILSKLFKVEELGLSDKKQAELNKLIKDNKVILIEDVTKITGANVSPYKPTFTSDTPIYQRQYRLPHGYYEPLRKTLDQLEKANIIRKCNSQWNSPVLLVPKRDSTDIRIVLDLRKINDLIEPVQYPIMRIDDILENLNGAHLFSSLDLNNGYFNIKLAPEVQERFSFSVPFGKYCFLKMIQGSKTSSAVFQQIMTECLSDVIRKGHVMVYLDDIIIYTKSVEEHLETLKEVLEALKGVNMAVRPSKCKLFQTSIKFLGHTVNKDGYTPLYDNVRTMQGLPRPTSVRGVRSFLGSLNFYRKFIPNFAEIAEPLYSLLKKKNVKICWNPEAEEAFQQLKLCLVSAPLLAHPDFNKPFVIKSDASLKAIAGVLEQENDEGDLQPVAYCSRKLNNAERNYAAIEREAMAIVFSIQQFRHLTYGNKITLRTDHKPLTYLFDLKETNARIARWLISIQDSDIHLEHIPGKLNTMADMLSRGYEDEVFEISAVGEAIPPISIARVFTAQYADEECWKILSDMQKGFYHDNEYILDSNQVIMRKVSDGRGYGSLYRTLIPVSLRQEVMYNYHDTISGGHFSQEKTLAKIKRLFTWPGMFRDIFKYVKSCDKCQKRNTIHTKAPFQPVDSPSSCMERLSVDILGPFETTNRRNKYLLVWVDHFSRMTFASPIPSQEAHVIARDYIDNIFTRYGSSKVMVSDRGPQLVGHIMSILCDQLGITRALTTSYKPNSNGTSERVNGKILNLLSHFCNHNYSDWDLIIKYVVQVLNNTEHRSHGKVPFYVFHGFHQRTPNVEFHEDDVYYEGDMADIVEEMMEKLEIARAEVFANLNRSSIKNCENKNSNRKLREFTSGQQVLLLDPASYTGKNRKLKQRYTGPFAILRRTGLANYELSLLSDPSITRKAHVDKIKEYNEREVIDNDIEIQDPEVPSDTDEELTLPFGPPIQFYKATGELIVTENDEEPIEEERFCTPCGSTLGDEEPLISLEEMEADDPDPNIEELPNDAILLDIRNDAVPGGSTKCESHDCVADKAQTSIKVVDPVSPTISKDASLVTHPYNLRSRKRRREE